MEWTLAHTDQASKGFMCELPFDLRFELGEHTVHLVHGSPRKVNEYLFEDKPARLYERLAAAEDADALVFGHTHKPWVHDYRGVRFINCGSVGKPKDGDHAAPSPSSPPPPTASPRRSNASPTTPRPSPARSAKPACLLSTPTSCSSPPNAHAAVLARGDRAVLSSRAAAHLFGVLKGRPPAARSDDAHRACLAGLAIAGRPQARTADAAQGSSAAASTARCAGRAAV